MKLVFDDPLRPQDEFVINDRTDGGDPLVKEGETFEVDDDRGSYLLGVYFPRLKPAPGTTATASKALSAADIIKASEPSSDLVDSNVNVADKAEREAE